MRANHSFTRTFVSSIGAWRLWASAPRRAVTRKGAFGQHRLCAVVPGRDSGRVLLRCAEEPTDRGPMAPRRLAVFPDFSGPLTLVSHASFTGNAFSDAAVLLLQAASSGGFIYLATSTLAEQQHAPRPKGRGRWAALPFYAAVLVGIAAVLAVHELPLGGHSHGGCSHSHDPAAGGGGAAGRHRSGHASSLRHHDEQPGHGQEHNEGRTALVAGRAAAAAEVADG